MTDQVHPRAPLGKPGNLTLPSSTCSWQMQQMCRWYNLAPKGQTSDGGYDLPFRSEAFHDLGQQDVKVQQPISEKNPPTEIG